MDLIASLIDDQSLAAAVQALAQSSPEAGQVVTRLLTHFQNKLQQHHASSTTHDGGEPDAKRMRLDGSTPLSSSLTNSAAASATASPSASSTSMWPPPASKDFGPAIYSTGPLSLLHPFRKKLALRFHQHEMTLVQTTGSSNETNVLAAAPWTALYRVIAVPFLERATKQTALLLFFRHQAVPTPKDAIWVVAVADDGKDFTLTCAPEHLHLLDLTSDIRDTSGSKKPDTVLLAILTRCLEYNNKGASNNSQDAYEIVANPTPAYPNFSAHLKSSQGTIYLLPKGILFAFKKPIIYLPANKIDAIGFHSIVSRTFDFEIVVSEDASPEDCEGVPPAPSNQSASSTQQRRTVGFGMVDTKEFAKVEEWIKKSGIRDRSMSEDLKAKDKAPVSSKKRERKDDDDDGDGHENTGGDGDDDGAKKKVAVNGAGGAKIDKGKGVAQQSHQDTDDDDDEDDEDFAPESEDEHMVEEYDSEAIGTDNDDDDEEMRPAASRGGGSSSRNRGRPTDDDDGESLGEDTDEDEEDEDDELEEEEEDVEGDAEADEEEEADNNDKDDNASVDLEAAGDEDEDEDDEEELRSEEGEEDMEEEVEDEEEEIDELEED
ncbi:hypothetical protein BGW41_000136 [Actinomortierella wolfii]|nr:hypothetical protein BGW41_000136 [Actinomortierella wolfii]